MAKRGHRLFRRCLGIMLAAVILGVAFNIIAPQGIGFLPAYVSDPAYQQITEAEAKQLWDKGALFIDARDPNHYKAGHIRRAVSLYPDDYELLLSLLKEQIESAPAVVVYGRTISRNPAGQVAQRLIRGNIAQAKVMRGCLDTWLAAGYPVRIPKRRVE